MKNRVEISVAGRNYTITAEEGKDYVQRVAAFVDGQINEVREATHVSALDAAVLAAVNLADLYFKEQEACANLRRQTKESADELGRTKLELSEARREIFRLSGK